MSTAATPPRPPARTRRTPRARWLVPAVLLLVWLALGGVGGQFQGRLAEVQENDSSSFLPASAESTEANELAAGFRDSDALPAFVVVEGEEALTPDQLADVAAWAEQLPTLEVEVEGAESREVSEFLVPGPVPVVPSDDGEAALLLVQLDGQAAGQNLDDGESALLATVEAIRAAESQLEDAGLQVYVAGPGGQLADLVEAFGEIDGILLGVALAAVLVILLVVYRSPVLPFLVILSAVFGLAVASIAVYFLADADVVTLSGQSQGILFILVVGAATDYALLLVARYREELRLAPDRYAAMGRAWRRTLEPVIASAATVVLGLLCLLLSDLGSNRALGPVGAIGVVAAVLAALTFLPAMLLLPGPVVAVLAAGVLAGAGAVAAGAPGAGAGAALALVGAAVAGFVTARRRRAATARGQVVEAGRWVFWPGVPHVGSAGPETRGVWARVARLVGRRPRVVWVATALVLGAMALPLPTLDADGVDQSDLFLTEVESVDGQEALARHFAAGSGSPTVVLAAEEDLAEVVSTVRAVDGVASAAPTVESAGGPPSADAPARVVDGRVQVEVVLEDASDSTAAEDTVRELRQALDAVGDDVLVGGTTAANLDVRETSLRDRTVIIPVVLGVIFVVLALLLRSLVAPVLLVAANVLSFAATLGVAAVVFDRVFGFEGGDPSVPLFGFVFLVALGIDYSIFLMTRVREEAQREGTRRGVLTGLAVTGGVITSAGVVLAATFSALGVLPILFLAQIAFIVAFGVLLDTFVVRSLLVPALVRDLGPRTWWPSRLSREDGGASPSLPRHREPQEPEPALPVSR